MPKSRDEALKTYRAKRRFDKTSEPQGGAAGAPGALYLIQKHDARRLHYDFRLELEGVLLSWAVTRGPSYNTRDKRLAVRTEDHPLEYGSFEGTIPAGNYGAGTVMLWDSGTWEPVGDVRQGLEDGKIAFVLHGERLRGRWALVRMRADEKARKAKRENWLLIKELDEYANHNPDLLEANTVSVASGRALAEIAEGGESWHAQGKLPDFQPPMLATLVDAAPRGTDWIFEVKYDGYRALIAADGADVRIFTRSGLDWTAKFPQIAKAAAALRLQDTLLDGEIVVIDAQGRTDFGALVAALESGRGALSYIVFDMLETGGRDLRGETLRARQAALRKILGKRGKSDVIQISEVFDGAEDTGEKLANSACAHGLEGILAKRADSAYRSGRHGDWQKIKCDQGQEFVIVGFAPSARGRPFASVLLAVKEDGAWRYAGKAGSGFSDKTLQQLATLRDKHKTKKPACDNVSQAAAAGATWVKPVLIAEIEFAGWTRDKMIRHGRFKGLRGDKKGAEIVREMPERETPDAGAAKKIGGVKITHPERAVFADGGVSKAEVAAYIESAAKLMMPFLQGRFVSFLRCPNGAEKKCFFQRHPSAGFGDAWREQKFATKEGKEQIYVFCESPEALIRAVQMGVLGFHIWGSPVKTPQKPDRIVFDLDPDEALPFETVKSGAFRLREVLAALDLESLPMLSGGKGIHVVAPIAPRAAWPVVKRFAAQLAARVAEDAPEKFVATMTKARRKGKIFIDHFRNEVAATAIAPYSPRARAGAPVAWPLSWTALQSADAANEMKIPAAHAALQAGENGWTGYFGIKQSLSAAALRALKVDE
jgi:bifunctional non-homologous end joining protein LigD